MWGNQQFIFQGGDAAMSEDGSYTESLENQSNAEPSYLEQFQELKFAALRRAALNQAKELSKAKGRCIVCTLPLPCVKHANHEKWDTAFAPAKVERSSIVVSDPGSDKVDSRDGLENESEQEAPTAKEDLAKQAEARRRQKIKKDLEEYHRRKEEEENLKQKKEQEAKEQQAAELAEKERHRKERDRKLKEDLQRMALAKEEDERKKAEDEEKAAAARKKREESQKRYHREQQDKLARWHIEKESKERAGLGRPAPASPRSLASPRSPEEKTSPAA